MMFSAFPITDASRRRVDAAPQQCTALAALLMCSSLLLGACSADRPLRTPNVTDAIRAELPAPVVPKATVQVPERISDALAEPAPAAVPLAPEPRIDLLVNNAQAREVFLAIVADTRYSMLMHPDVAGTLSGCISML
jgi:MSHA biogenesis protein MshL